jgi:hypothetical protein
MTTDDLSSTFEWQVYEKLPDKLLNLLNTKYSQEKATIGIYIHAHDTQHDQVRLTFLHGHGEIEAIKLMLTLRDSINTIISRTFESAYYLSIHKTVTDWVVEYSDIISKCQDLYSCGILVAINSDSLESKQICAIKDGKAIPHESFTIGYMMSN